MLIMSALVYYLMNKFHHTGENYDYWKLRDDFIDDELKSYIGYKPDFSDKENRVNEIFRNLKFGEYDQGMAHPITFLAGHHFYDVREDIKTSEVYKFIQKVPKGGLLHVHDIGMSSYEFFYNITFWDDLYYCRNQDGLMYRFFDKPDKTCAWKLLASAHSDKHLEEEICNSLSIFKPECTFKNSHDAWGEFNKVWKRIEGLVTYRPVYEKMIYHGLELLCQENIMYVELRSQLTPLYDINGETCDDVTVASVILDVVKKFKRDNKNFLDVKLIYSPHRFIDDDTLDHYIETAEILKKKFPTFFIGFDLMGEEDAGRPLRDFADKLKKLDVKAYFHAGETTWYGTTIDINLIDAVLLGSRRIAGAYNILRHDKVLQCVKDNNIAIEITPLSGQMMYYTKDIHANPGSVLLSQNYPLVIGSDNPALWGATGVSFDWYYTIMGLATRECDLGVIRQLAKNSIEYSGMEDDLKKKAWDQWKKEWELFLDNILTKKHYKNW